MQSCTLLQEASDGLRRLCVEPFVNRNDQAFHAALIREHEDARLKLCDQTDAALDADAELDDLKIRDTDSLKQALEDANLKVSTAQQEAARVQTERDRQMHRRAETVDALKTCEREMDITDDREIALRQASALLKQSLPQEAAELLRRADDEREKLITLTQTAERTRDEVQTREDAVRACDEELAAADSLLQPLEDVASRCALRLYTKQCMIAYQTAARSLEDARSRTIDTLHAELLQSAEFVLNNFLAGGPGSEQPQQQPWRAEDDVQEEGEEEEGEEVGQASAAAAAREFAGSSTLQAQAVWQHLHEINVAGERDEEENRPFADHDGDENSDTDSDPETTVVLSEDDDFDLNDITSGQREEGEIVERGVKRARAPGSGNSTYVAKVQRGPGSGPRLFCKRIGNETPVGDFRYSCSALALKALRAASGEQGKAVSFESIKFQLSTAAKVGAVKNSIQRMSGTAATDNFADIYVNAHKTALGEDLYSLAELGLARLKKWGI